MEDVLPTLSEDEAIAELAVRGIEFDGRVLDLLPRLASRFLGGPALSPLDAHHHTSEFVRAVDEKLAALATGLIVEAFILLDGDAEVTTAVLREGPLPSAWSLAYAMQECDGRDYAVVTSRFGAPHLLLGDVTGRCDALVCRLRELPDGTPGRSAWRDHATQDAHRFARIVNDHFCEVVRPTPVVLNVDPEHDWLIALEFGRVDEGQPADAWVTVADGVRVLHDGSGSSASRSTTWPPSTPRTRRAPTPCGARPTSIPRGWA